MTPTPVAKGREAETETGKDASARDTAIPTTTRGASRSSRVVAAVPTSPSTSDGDESGSATLNPMFVLAHFCELHGPSVLFCTQLIRPSSTSSSSTSTSSSSSSEQEQDVHGANAATSSSSSSSSPTTAASALCSPPGRAWAFPLTSGQAGAALARSTTNAPILKLDVASSAILPTDSMRATSRSASGASSSSSASSSSGRRSTPACPSCHALPSDSGFFSVDDDNGTYFITTRYPAATYARIRTACVRALSCEFSPGREGPMFFGDEENGFCLSYVFKVHDLQARGFVRWYGILFLAPQASLLTSTDFLVGSVKGVVKDLQAKSAAIFQQETEEKERLQAQQSTQAPSGASPSGMSHLRSRTNFPTGPGAFRRRQIHANAPLRGLDALLKDQQLPGRLHASFAWVLQQWARQHLLSPIQPFYTAAFSLPTFTSPSPSSPSSPSSPALAVGEVSTAGAGQPSSPTFSFLSPDTRDGTHEEQREEESEEEGAKGVVVFETLQQLMHALGPGKFNALLCNVLYGNQVIVRGECRPLVASILRLLTELVPERCAKVRSWETEAYHESWEFNFLGVSRDVAVPDYIALNTYALIDILPHPRLLSSPSASLLPPPAASSSALFSLSPPPQRLSSSSSSSSPSSSSSSSSLSTASPATAMSPRSVPHAWTSYRYQCHAQMEGAMSTLSAEVVSVLCLNLPRRFETQRLQAIRHAWSSRAKAFFTVARLVEGERDARLLTFLSATGLLEADLPVLRYWTTGLRHNLGLLRLMATQQQQLGSSSTARAATASVPYAPTRSATYMGQVLLQSPQSSSSFSRTASIYSPTA